MWSGNGNLIAPLRLRLWSNAFSAKLVGYCVSMAVGSTPRLKIPPVQGDSARNLRAFALVFTKSPEGIMLASGGSNSDCGSPRS